MSFFSSLALFYPGVPPLMTASQLCDFAEALRAVSGVNEESEITLELKCGERMDQDYESTTSIDWDSSGILGTYNAFEWDGEWQWGRGEPRPPELTANPQMVYRSYMRAGWLLPEACEQLRRQDEKDSTCGFWPDSLCISVDPFCPKCLGDDDDLLCVGLIAVTFSGNGYFSWGVPWSAYAEQYMAAGPVREAMRIARSHFPVGNAEIIPKIEAALGERFLNRSYYEAGDWILTPSESG
jgi:hypothetical protein